MVGHFLVLHSQGSSNIHSIILFLNFGGLSLPWPAIWCCQNIMFGPGLQKDSANLLVFSLLTWSNPCVLGRWSLGRGPKLFTSVTHWFVCLSCIRAFCICVFSNFVLSTSTFTCTHFLIFMCQSDWGKDQPSLPFKRHKTLNLTSMATKIIGSPETKWIDATSGIYNSDKSSNLSVVTDFSESLQNSVSILRSGSTCIEQSICRNCVWGKEFLFEQFWCYFQNK